MKSLVEFIKEHLINESERKEIRIEVKDVEGYEDFLDTLKSSLNSKDIYNEKIDNGLKFVIQGDDKEKYAEILNILKGWKKGQDKLEGAINTLETWISQEPEEPKEKEDDENKEDSKDEDE